MPSPSLTLRPLAEDDRAAWDPLWDGYLTFYGTELEPGTTDAAWARLFDPSEAVGAIGAFDDGRLVGFAHHLLHRSTWSTGWYCYLEDLYTAPDARGRGVARSLIEDLAQRAAAAGATKLYWHTAATNATARSLYDQVAAPSGHLVYERDLTAVR